MTRIKSIFLTGAAVFLLLGLAFPAGAQTAHFQGPSSPRSEQGPVAPDDLTQLNADIRSLKSTNLLTLKQKRQLDLMKLSGQTKAVTVEAAAEKPAVAADNGNAAGTGGVSISPIPNSKDNYLDDHLTWRTSIHVHATTADGGVDLNNTYCLPAQSRVIGLAADFTSGAKNPDGKGEAPATGYLPVQLDPDGGFFTQDLPSEMNPPSLKEQDSKKRMCDGSGVPSFPLAADTQFFIDTKDLENADREGLDFGTLVVPFKFQMSDESAITTSATLGGYVGYRIPIDFIGLRIRPVAFVGLSEVPVSQIGSDGKTKSENLAGLSYGFGLIGTIKDKFNLGIVFGADHVDSVPKYKYQDKPWVSLVLGLSLTK